jgi:endonuclease/exonuclease/phosphatase family metal-dependent hydrolase
MMKIATLNLNYDGESHGPWRVRRRRIAEALARHRPDVAVFQSVKRDIGADGGLHQAEQLAQFLADGYSHTAFKAAQRSGDGADLGSAFMSRLPLVETQVFALHPAPQTEDPSKRMMLRGLFQASLGPLHIFNAHFSWVTDQAMLNVREALEFTRWISGPALLVGDMNCEPSSEPMRLLGGSGWTDAWAHLRPESPGYTFDAKSPDKRIDYVWVNAPLKDRLESVELVEEPGENEWLSDHRSLLVTLSA